MVFLCCDNLNKAQLWCKLRMHEFIKKWGDISIQYYKLRADQLLNLQNLSEIYVTLIFNFNFKLLLRIICIFLVFH